MSTAEFRLPDLGEGLTSAELMSWRVDIGEQVSLDQVIADVETAKALVELPSPYAGVVTELLVEPGTTVPVGAPIIRIESAAESSDEAVPNVLVGYGPEVTRSSRRRRKVPDAVRHVDPDAVRHVDPDAVRRVDPDAVRRVDPDAVRHVDPDAVRQDRHLARAMVESVRTPQATVFLTVDVSASMNLLQTLRNDADFENCSVTPLTLAAKSLVTAIASNPRINSTWDAEAERSIVHPQVNLGIAVASDHGLLVPNIKEADGLSLLDIARGITELTATARAGLTDIAHLTGGTVTITNVGVFGVDGGVALLNPGECVILCLGGVNERPWVYEGRIDIRHVVTLSMTFDHRALDGRQAAEFLALVASMLSDPAVLLAHL